MPRWLVISPTFTYIEDVLGYGQGPAHDVADTIEIEAETKRDALLLGVKAMRADCTRYTYHHTEYDRCPFTGMTVIERCD